MSGKTKRLGLILPCIALLLVIMAVYAGSLSAPLVFDDENFFSAPEMVSANAQLHLTPRSLSYATLSWTVEWLGSEPFWLRLGNVLLHALNCIALFILLRRLFQVVLTDDAHVENMQFGSNGLAWLGALVFALHPVAVYCVAYAVQRSTLMATLFVLLMLTFYMEGVLRGGRRWMIAAAICYFAAVYSKEHSVMAPVVAMALTLLIRKPSVALFKRTAPYYLLIAAVIVFAWVLLSDRGVLGRVYEPNGLVMLEHFARIRGLSGLDDLSNPHLLSILTQSTLFFKYLGLWLIPNPAWMSVDMRESFALTLVNWTYTPGLIAFLAVCGGATWLLFKRGKLGLLGFSLLFPGIMFITEFSSVRIQEPFVLYRSYLWMPGLFAILPVLIGAQKTARAYVALGVVCLALVPLTLNRLHTFSNPLLLWDDAEKLVRNRPDAMGAERIYYNRGTELGKLHRYSDAIADFDRAIAVHPFDYLYGNRATAYYFLGRYEEALHDYSRAIAINQGNPKSFQGRALAYVALGNFDAAQSDFSKACALGLCSQN